MVKNHLKRLNVPTSWVIKKKSNVFITRPKPCGHVTDHCMPINVILRDMLKIGKTTKEIKHILFNNDVLVNGKKRDDVKFAMGFMDVLDIKILNEAYRLIINHKNKLVTIKVDEKEKNILLLKVKNKTLLKGGNLQVNFTDGSNLLVEKDEFKVNDVVVFDFVKKKVQQILKLEKGCLIYIVGGRYVGGVVKLESIKDNEIVFRTDDNEVFTTSLRYAFVVGKDKPVINLNQE